MPQSVRGGGMQEVVIFLFGGLFGLMLSVYLEEPWKDRRSRRRRLRRSKAIMRARGDDSGAMIIAGYATRVHIVEGDGGLVLEPHNVTVDLRSTSAELDPLVATSRDRHARSIAASKPDGQTNVAAWNGESMVALNRYR